MALEGAIFLLALPSLAPSYNRMRGSRMGKCLMCGKETHKVLFSKAIVKIYICSIDCLKEYHKPIKGFRLRIQKG